MGFFKEIRDTFSDVADAVGDVGESFKSGSKKIGRTLGYDRVVPGIAKKPPRAPAPIPLPDMDALRRVRRRAAASRAGYGRFATILSEDEEEQL